MRRRDIAIGLIIIAVVAFSNFMFVPEVWVNTHPSTVIPELAFVSVPVRESYGCVVFGIGAADWPVPANASTYQSVTYHFQLGCPPSNQNGYVYTRGNTTVTVSYTTLRTGS